MGNDIPGQELNTTGTQHKEKTTRKVLTGQEEKKPLGCDFCTNYETWNLFSFVSYLACSNPRAFCLGLKNKTVVWTFLYSVYCSRFKTLGLHNLFLNLALADEGRTDSTAIAKKQKAHFCDSTGTRALQV